MEAGVNVLPALTVVKWVQKWIQELKQQVKQGGGKVDRDSAFARRNRRISGLVGLFFCFALVAQILNGFITLFAAASGSYFVFILVQIVVGLIGIFVFVVVQIVLLTGLRNIRMEKPSDLKSCIDLVRARLKQMAGLSFAVFLAAIAVGMVSAVLGFVAFILFVPIAMAHFFAPALIVWRQMGVVESIVSSFNACLKNWKAFAVFGLILIFMLVFGIFGMASAGWAFKLPLIAVSYLGFCWGVAFVAIPILLAFPFFYEAIYEAQESMEEVPTQA